MIPLVAAWREIEQAEPAFAAHVRRCFGVRRHCTLATLRRGGSPRISGIEVEFDDGQLSLGMMPDSRKALDLRRDIRFALHSPTADPPEEPASWLGEAKVAGRALEVSDAQEGALRFHADVTEVVLTTIGGSGDHLLIRCWHPDRGLEKRHRY